MTYFDYLRITHKPDTREMWIEWAVDYAGVNEQRAEEEANKLFAEEERG